jgi:hypothetical protein
MIVFVLAFLFAPRRGLLRLRGTGAAYEKT